MHQKVRERAIPERMARENVARKWMMLVRRRATGAADILSRLRGTLREMLQCFGD